MITQLKFQNFKALKNAELKLGAFNVIIGPNGSGKSSVLQALEALANPNKIDYNKTVTSGNSQEIRITAASNFVDDPRHAGLSIRPDGLYYFFGDKNNELHYPPNNPEAVRGFKLKPSFDRIKIYSFEATSLSQSVGSGYITELNRDGKNLAGALTHLRDKDEDAYNRLRVEFQKWIPEFDAIGFDTDQNGTRNITLRQKLTRHTIHASQASEGTLLALALLTIVYQPTPPVLIGLEEPDRGLHPRLLRELRDALYRLAFPSDFGIKRAPVQVVVTTHSPFFLDLFKDHPEQVIIAEKQKDGSSTFKNLSEDRELRDLIGDAPLGEIWYSGILGGVPIPA